MFGKKEIERLKEVNASLAKKVDEFEAKQKLEAQQYELSEKKAVAALEDKLQKEVNKLEKQYQDKLHDFKTKQLEEQSKKFQDMTQANYDKLATAMAKMHDEGNVQTKFVQEQSKEIIRAVGLGNRQQKEIANG